MEQQMEQPRVQAGGAVSEKKPRRRKKRVRRIILVCALVLVLGLIGLGFYSRLRQEYTVTYQEYTASVGTISNSLSFSGTLQAVDSATYTAPSAGTVRAVYVQAGSQVKEGDRLLRLASGTVVEAEFDGTVNQLPVKEGDKVAAGDTLAQVVDFSRMKVSFRVDEYDIDDVKVGDAARATMVASEKTYETSVDNINYVSSSTGTVAYYTATAYLDVEGGAYPGMQVTVTVPRDEASDVVILKEDALSFDLSNQAFVYVQDASGNMVPSYVTLGVSNGNYVEIVSGLRGGDTVYAVVKSTDTASGGFMSGLFGSQRINGGQQQRQNRNSTQQQNRQPGSGGQYGTPGGMGGGTR